MAASGDKAATAELALIREAEARSLDQAGEKEQAGRP
jgi:hypothetical protein